jgi:hypothetical protein
MPFLAKQMMNGQSTAKYTALVEAIQIKDVDVSLRGTDDIDIALGRSQEELCNLIMGLYWSKMLLVETIHVRCRTMESHAHKLLLSDGIFSKDCKEEYLGIFNASDVSGYDALHNILRHHPSPRRN